jgi:hypothetical protein
MEDTEMTEKEQILQSLYDRVIEPSEALDQLEKAEIAEIKATPMPSGWICPRCQKVHSWLSMSCDCEPNTITSTTY